MAGTLPILKIRSSNFLVGLLTAIPMTCYNERKIFKILKFLTHPINHEVEPVVLNTINLMNSTKVGNPGRSFVTET